MYQLASAQNSIQRQLRAQQEDIACTLKQNNSLMVQFESSIRELHGVRPDFSESYRLFSHGLLQLLSDINFYTILSILPVDSTFRAVGILGHNSFSGFRCRATECTGDTDTIWCINLYHPSRKIEMCLNFSSGEINMTDYARRLGMEGLLQKVFLQFSIL